MTTEVSSGPFWQWVWGKVRVRAPATGECRGNLVAGRQLGPERQLGGGGAQM